MKKMAIGAVILLAATALPTSAQQLGAKVGKTLPDWKEGYLDIHAVNSGQGECSLLIFPDGTTMLLDAGETRPDAMNIVPPKPDSITPPYETYAKYINHFIKPTGHKDLDYALISHFHEDHMCQFRKNAKLAPGKPYYLNGFPGVGDKIHFSKIIDRSWPDYMDAVEPVSKAFPNYLNFVKYQKENNGTKVEKFRPGVNDQLVLTRNPKKYTNFEIRNIVANGVVWTGIDTITRNYFIPCSELPKEAWPNENMCSIGFRVSYGPFDYFTGGDLPALTPYEWQHIEAPVGAACGPVDAMKSNHHMNYDTMGIDLLKRLRPQVIVAHTRKAQQPDIEVLRSIHSNTKAYAGKVKDVYTTNMHFATPYYIWPNVKKMPATQGHIVIRVSPGGEEFYVYALSDTSDGYEVQSIHGPYKSK